MKESVMFQPTTPDELKPKEELEKEGSELMDVKREYLDSVRASVKEMFGTEELPKELVMEMINIRREIKDAVGQQEYSEQIDDVTEQKIRSLMFNMTHFENDVIQVENIIEDEDENLIVLFENGETEIVDTADKELLESLEVYFDSYRMAYNAARFRNNVSDAVELVVGENKSRKLNFYSKGEKNEALVEKVFEKYEQIGFKKEEIEELIKTCDLKKLDSLEIHQIKILSKIGETFSKFMEGDKTKYVNLSAALMIPAFLEGYAPMFLANAFKGDKIEMTQIGLYALISSAAVGGSIIIEKYFKDFLDTNFQKEEGYSDYIAENTAEIPGDELGNFGTERIKGRIANAKNSYEKVLRTISFDILPAGVTLTTSAAMLYDKSPVLAGGTVAGTGIMMMVDKYVNKKGKFWEKERRAEGEAEQMAQKMEELLSAHMEVILSGEKEQFMQEMEELLSKERVAMSDQRFLGVVRRRVMESYSILNFMAAAVATSFAGGASDKFIAALVYSGNFNKGISRIIDSKRSLLSSFRDMMQLEIMFNGYAEEEKEKEQNRHGMNELNNNDISLQGVGVEFQNRKILDDISLEIPEGSMVSLNGVSGAGKTTLMKVLAGYYEPTEGTVEIGNTDMDDIKKSGPDSIYSKIAYLSQFPHILEDSVRNNLTFGIAGDVSDSEIKEILEEVGLGERFSNLDEQLKMGRGDVGTTSGGETSRIGWARVILKMRKNDSKIVFFDEPAASVDDETTIKLVEMINNEKNNNPETTFISISQDKVFSEGLNSDMLVEIKNGKVESITN